MTPETAWLLKNRPGVGFLSSTLNEGRKSGFKAGDRVEYKTAIGQVRTAEVWDQGPKRGEWWLITDDGFYVLLKALRPKSPAELRTAAAPRRVIKRDAWGRFAA